MTDLRERFRVLDAVEVPDLRSAIVRRPPATVPRPRPLPRLLAATVAVSVAILGIGAGIRGFFTGNETLDPAGPGSGRVERVLDIETYPGGADAPDVPGPMIARAVVDRRVWTFSVTPDPEDEDDLCFHTKAGAGEGVSCGPANIMFGLIGLNLDVDLLTPEGSGTSFVYGQVAPIVSEVIVSFSDSTVLSTHPIDLPPRYDVDFYIVGVTGTLQVDSVRALDENGRVLEEVTPQG